MLFLWLCNKPQIDSPLIQACWNGHNSVVDQLLSNGARVNDTKQDGSTPLHLSVVRHQHATVKRLLAQGRTHELVDPTITWVHCINMDGNNPLHIASSAGCIHAAEMLLLDEGSVIDDAIRMMFCKNQGGQAPIHIAAYHGHADLVRLFVECVFNGTHPGSIDGNGNLVEVDVGALGPDLLTDDGSVALFIAAERGFLPICKLLLDAGGNVNYQHPSTNMTAMHYAAKTSSSQHRDIVLLLGQYNPRDTVDSHGLTPLCVACSRDSQPDQHSINLIRALLEVNPSAVNPSGTRDGIDALMCSCGCACPSDLMLPIVRILLEKGADVKSCLNTSQNTALHMAASRGSFAICKLLLENGANKASTNLGGLEPATLARRNNQIQTAVFIEGFDGGGVR